MKVEYITIPLDREERERHEIRERVEVAVAIAQVAVGIAIFIALILMAVGASLGVERLTPADMDKTDIAVETATTVTAPPMKVYTASAADLYVVEYDNSHFRDEPKMVNPSPLTDSEWAVLLEVCDSRSIDPSLALGLIQVESAFVPTAVSPSGCYGYTQVNPAFHPANLSPADNIRYGLNYLADLMEKYDSTEAGLTAYFWGYDNGTRGYANRVLKAAEEWRNREETQYE